MTKSQTPVTEIFDPSLSKRGPSTIEKVKQALEFYGITTVEQLVTYNQFAFKVGGNTEARGKLYQGNYGTLNKTQYQFLQRCLNEVGLSFAPEKDIREPSPYQTIGKENIKEYILSELEQETEDDSWLSPGDISRRARDHLTEKTEGFQLGFYRLAFRKCYVEPLLQKFIKEGKASRIFAGGKEFFRKN